LKTESPGQGPLARQWLGGRKIPCAMKSESSRNWFTDMSTNRRSMVGARMALLAVLVFTALSVQATCQRPLRSPARTELQQHEIERHNDSLEIKVRFPALEGDETFNKAVRHRVAGAVDEFKKGLPKTVAESYPDYGSYLHGTYKAEVLQNGVISVLLAFDEYSSGAAHPWGVLSSIVYDTKRRRTVLLADLFQPGADYVQRLSELAVKSLEQNEFFDAQAIHLGAGPIESNFKVFTLTQDALVLHFQQYQVAAGAMGAQQVSIPLTTLSPILRSRFRSVELSGD